MEFLHSKFINHIATPEKWYLGLHNWWLPYFRDSSWNQECNWIYFKVEPDDHLCKQQVFNLRLGVTCKIYFIISQYTFSATANSPHEHYFPVPSTLYSFNVVIREIIMPKILDYNNSFSCLTSEWIFNLCSNATISKFQKAKTVNANNH